MTALRSVSSGRALVAALGLGFGLPLRLPAARSTSTAACIISHFRTLGGLDSYPLLDDERLVSTSHCSRQGGGSRRKPVGKREHSGFVGFERDLLGEHHITRRQSTFGNETPAGRGLPICVDFYNIAHGTIVNSIASAGV